jgi:hypothetical protein
MAEHGRGPFEDDGVPDCAGDAAPDAADRPRGD